MPPSRRRMWIITGLLLAVAAVGAGMAVRADLDSRPAVIPYDPLKRW